MLSQELESTERWSLMSQVISWPVGFSFRRQGDILGYAGMAAEDKPITKYVDSLEACCSTEIQNVFNNIYEYF